MRRIVASLCLAVLFGGYPALALAGNWQVRRNSKGVCSLQPSDGVPLLGSLLSKSPTKKEACESARSRMGADPGKTATCAGYTRNTVELCHRQAVDIAK
jgi:hypothetical protein